MDPTARTQPPEAFPDRLLARIEATGSLACVGLDPRLDALPDELRAAPDPLRAFGEAVIDLVRGKAAATKPQLAFYEDEPEAAFALARRGGPLLPTIADAKRGDIGTTAEAYATRWLGPTSPCDALTVNPYLGRDSLEPLVAEAARNGKGLFVLVKTSNPGSKDIQDLRLDTGELVYERVARLVDEIGRAHVGARGFSLVGAVVGATAAPEVVARLRELMPRALFLMPGWGAQGGSAASVARALDAKGQGVLVPSSRALNFPWRTKDPKAKAPADWRGRIVAELESMNRELAALRGQRA